MCINQHAKYLRKSNKSALGGLANSKGISVKLGMGRSSDHLTNITWLVTSNCLGNACSFHPCIFLDVRSVWYVWWSVKAVFKPGSSPDYQYWSLVLLTTVVWGSIPPYRGADSIMFASYLLLALHSKQHDWLSHYFLFHGFMMAGREVCSAEETECLTDIYNQTFIGLGQCNLLTSVVQVHALRASWKKHVSCCPAWLKTLLKENSSVFYDIPTWWHAMHSERTVRHCLSVGYQRKIINSKHLNLVPKRFPNDSSDVLNCTIDPWFGNNSSTWKQSCNYESFLSNKPRISPGCGLKHSDQVGKRPYLPWIANKVIEQHLGNWFIV